MVSEGDGQHSIRRHIIDSLRRDLIGPSWKEGTTEPDLNEVIDLQDSNPSRRYLGGYLEPARNSKRENVEALPETIIQIDQRNQHSSLDEKPHEMSDEKAESVESDMMLSPSSMGLTFATEANSINVEVNWGEYSLDGNGLWVRSHHVWNGKIGVKNGEFVVNPPPAEGIRIVYKCRFIQDKTNVTIRLVNDREVITDSDGKNIPNGNAIATIYQPNIIVTSNTNFVDVRSKKELEEDPVMSVLYRKSRVLGFGHNVGVNWSDDEKRIMTEHIPDFEIPKMVPDKSLNEHIPSMDELTNSDTIDDSLQKLLGLIDEYDNWILTAEKSLFDDIKSNKYHISSNVMKEAIAENLSNAKLSSTRMREGVQTIMNDDMVKEAFILSNKAIQISQEGPTGPAGISVFKWYPFQIAFQLLNLNGIISTEPDDKYWKDRDKILDLAWFPTGGGKTEAYLGLISLTGFYRRLRYPEQEKIPSVHVIMRYTLRLLTMDQSERLVRLVTAMNIVSSDHESPSINNGVKFRVGMWVGKAASPNQLKSSRDRIDADSIIKDMQKGEGLKTNTRVIMFENCPWCGDSSISDPNNWSIGKLNERDSLIGKCKSEGCPYNCEEGIPFTPVDDDIYNNPPSILLGTADKFVQAAHNRTSKSNVVGIPANIRNLLGFNGHNRPPDLIIQDELHLLTGPLGSMAGLIETALDVAWSEACGGHRPKYVAATATIRGADRDAKLMFGKELRIFPPPVDVASDNFFAREASTSKIPGRIHLSVLGPPNKSRTVSDQPMASILQSAHEIRNISDDELVDPYWTLVSYYNSLRELGGAQSSLSTRVKSEWVPEFSSGEFGEREITNLQELTSRVPQDKLVATKSALENTLSHESPVDVVVTSNMFQVGIDISRLGVMTINGQPKSNSEYIQSSGRVGRKFPGLVVSLLRSTYPRDQSHYESHRAFHQEIYRHVDRTSTTPFSLRSLDRALDTTLMALIRMSCESLSERDSLNRIIEGNRRLVRLPAENAIETFRESIRGRLEEAGTSSGNDQRFIQEIIREIDRSWTKLKRWVSREIGEDKICCWLSSSNNSSSEREVAWARSSGEKSGVFIISSLRDVADEVTVARAFKIDHPGYYRYGRLPEGHLLSHTSPGSIWEKDGRSYLTLGINRWENRINHPNPPMETPLSKGGQWIREKQIEADSRLLRTRERDPVKRIRALPTDSQEHGHVSYRLFPETHRCESGHLSKPRVNENEETICGIEDCSKPATQMRFVSICSGGHIHDFDYRWWVHRGSKISCQSNLEDISLELRKGHAYDLKQWVLKCKKCGTSKHMKRVPIVSEQDKDADTCGKYGEPWLQNVWNERERCEEKKVHRQVGSASVTYNRNTSILMIPLTTSWSLANSDIVSSYLSEPDENGMLELYNFKKNRGTHDQDLKQHLENSAFHNPEDNSVDIDRFFKTLAEFKLIQNQGPLAIDNVRKREWSGLHFGKGSGLGEEFSSTKITLDESPWGEGNWPISNMSRVDRLTELRYITGISRVLDSNEEIPIDDPDTDRENYGIGAYNFGEGIYLDVNTKWLEDQALNRISKLGADISAMPFSMGPGRLPKNIEDQIPSIKEISNRNGFTILHTFSHLLIKQLCVESGYSLGSVRERLYYDANDGSINHAGILIYTSGPSSDGTLGGLAGQAGLKRMKEIIQAALNSRVTCSNDPVCNEHEPLDREPNGAACHTCVILPETSCECRNHMLDRNWGD